MVDGGALEKRYTLTGIVGSNPTLTARAITTKNPGRMAWVFEVEIGSGLGYFRAATTALTMT